MSARKAAAAKQVTRRKGAPPQTAKRAVPKPAAPAAANGDASLAVKALAADIDRALAEGRTDFLSKDAIQALMAAACRSYSARIESGESFAPLADRSRVTSTDVMVTASGLLKSANLAVFELGMWQSWTGR
jgi:hypothetical protein